MSDVTMEKLDGILQEDKWTRVNVSNYSLAKLKELDNLIDEIIEKNLTEEALDICNKHLKDIKKSISGLYISGIIIYSRRPLNDMNLITVIDLFSQNLKWSLVEHICNKMLFYSENKHALYTLAKIYSQSSNNEKLPDIWTRIVELDIDDTTFVRYLANYFEEIDLQKSIYYYRKAIYRFINKKQMSGLKEVWVKLINYSADDFDSLLLILQKVEKDLGARKAIVLYEDLCEHYSAFGNVDETIEILKCILKIDSRNQKAREGLVNFLKEKYKDIESINEYIEKSDLLNIDKNFKDIYSDFEKYLFFAKGNFVYHQTWSVGVIKEVDDNGIIIDFVKKRGHFVSFKMAVSALTSLEKEDIRVLKAIKSRQELSEKVKKEVEWTLKTIINSYKSIDIKGIKKELVPSLITNNFWNSWSLKAKEILKNNPHFIIASNKADYYMYNKKASNLNEKMYDKFKLEKDFYKRYEILISYINSKNFIKDDHVKEEMLNYFFLYLSNFSKVDHHIVSSYIILKSLKNSYPEVVSKFNMMDTINLEVLLESYSKDIVELFDSILNIEIKRDFIILIKEELKNWVKYYKELFPYYVNKKIVDALYREKEDEVRKLFNYVVKNYKVYKDAYIWVLKYYKTYGVALEFSDLDLISNLIKILIDNVAKVNNKSNVVLNKRTFKMIMNLLIKDKYLSLVLKEVNNREFAKRVYMTCFYIKDFPTKELLDIKSEIRSVFKDFEFDDEKAQIFTEKSETGFFTLLSSFNKKQKELQYLQDVEIPENSKEIGKARKLGDLKENSEYHAAKERQQFLTKRLNSLMIEIEQAKVMDIKEIQGSVVSFGTRVTILNKISNKDETYLILGPWESNPDRGIISYKSPFGANLLDSYEGEELDFKINEIHFEYLVKKIEVLKVN